MNKSSIRRITTDGLNEINTVEELLEFLAEPTWIFLPGENQHTCRVITTLLHGNEPSGCHVAFRLIKESYRPAVDTWILIASVPTALQAPIFSRRVSADNQDINRCFKAPWRTKIEKLAEQIITDIRGFGPDSIIDVHNTSGAGPGFCVSTSSSASYVKLAGLFSNSLVITNFKLGALMEVDFNCPILTVECGGNQSDLSHLFAYSGIHKFLSLNTLSAIAVTDDIHCYHNPLRVELKKGCHLTYSDAYLKHSDITLCQSIEEHNFGTTLPSQKLGWLGENGLQCLQAFDFKHNDLVDIYFEDKWGELYTRIPLHLFMVTTNSSIAKSDCLFYLTSAVIA